MFFFPQTVPEVTWCSFYSGTPLSIISSNWTCSYIHCSTVIIKHHQETGWRSLQLVTLNIVTNNSSVNLCLTVVLTLLFYSRFPLAWLHNQCDTVYFPAFQTHAKAFNKHTATVCYMLPSDFKWNYNELTGGKPLRGPVMLLVAQWHPFEAENQQELELWTVMWGQHEMICVLHCCSRLVYLHDQILSWSCSSRYCSSV